MRQWLAIAAACICAAIVAPHAIARDAAPAMAAQGTLQAAFAPWDHVEGVIIDEIAGARRQVLVQAYLLTSKKIANALIAAYRRGVDVRVLADAEQLSKIESSMLPDLAATGIPVWLETKYQNAHNKIVVIDAATPDATVITGSFNFTWNAQHKNAENIIIVRRNPSLASQYTLNWERHRQDAMQYKK